MDNGFWGILGVGVGAVLSHWFTRRTQDSEAFLREAILSMERAYEVLSNGDKEVSPPEPNRLNWLTAARHIAGYYKLKDMIKCDGHKEICASNEIHWQKLFSKCLETKNGLSLEFYNRNKPGIQVYSALIVHDFAMGTERFVTDEQMRQAIAKGNAKADNFIIRLKKLLEKSKRSWQLSNHLDGSKLARANVIFGYGVDDEMLKIRQNEPMMLVNIEGIIKCKDVFKGNHGLLGLVKISSELKHLVPEN
ncbi:MAG: hypothetical protein ACRCSI_04305 [Eubacterium aggregans]